MVQPFSINMQRKYAMLLYCTLKFVTSMIKLLILTCYLCCYCLGLITPMGMMGHGIMPPMGVPPPGMQGILGGPIMAQQMLQQGVNVPFTNAGMYLWH